MLLIITEHQAQLQNLIQTLQGVPNKVTPWLYLIQTPQTLPAYSQIAALFLPSDLFLIKQLPIYRPTFKTASLKQIRVNTNQLPLRINTQYQNIYQQTKKSAQQLTSEIWLATDNTNQGNFLGYHLCLQWQLQNKITKRLYLKNQTKREWERVLYTNNDIVATQRSYYQYYYLRLIQWLYYINYSRGITTLLHQSNYPSIYHVSALQSLIINHLEQIKQKNRLLFITSNQQKFISKKLFTRQQIKTALQNNSVQGKVTNIHHSVNSVLPPRMPNIWNILQYICSQSSTAPLQALNKAIKPLYYQYHLINNYWTDNHWVTRDTFNSLNQQKNKYLHLWQDITHQKLNDKIRKPRNNINFYLCGITVTPAIVPLKCLNFQQYQQLPKLIQLAYKYLVKHVLVLFLPPSIINTTSSTIQLDSYKFINRKSKVTVSGWKQLSNNKLTETTSNSFKRGQNISGQLKLNNSKPLNYFKLQEFLKQNHLLPVSKRLPIFQLFNQWGNLNYYPKLQFTQQGQLINHVLKQTLSKQRLPLSLMKYEEIKSKINQKLNQNTQNIQFIGQQSVKKVNSDIQNGLSKILLRTLQVPQKAPQTSQNQVITTTSNLCPNCHKNQLILVQSQANQHIYKHYICQHCHLDLPHQIGTIVITPSVLQLILGGLFAPAIFTAHQQQLRGRLVYDSQQKNIVIQKE